MLFLENASSELLTRLIDTAIRSMLLAGAIFLAVRAFRMRSAPLEHALWSITIVGMAVMPIATGLLPQVRVPIPISNTSSIPVLTEQPISSSTEAKPVEGLRQQANSPTWEMAGLPGWRTIAAASYLLVSAVLLARLALGLLLLRRVSNTSAVLRGSTANDTLEEVAAEYGLGYPLPTLCESNRVAVPMVPGTNAAMIVLPEDWREWDRWKLRAVLAHEACHIRRRDWLFFLIAAVNRCIFWFHPLAWKLEKRLRSLAEQACDDAAALLMRDPARYARILLEISSAAGMRRIRFSENGVIAASMAGCGPVTRRIHRILEVRDLSCGVVSKRGWAATMVCTIPIVSALAAAQVPPPQNEKRALEISTSWNWQEEGARMSPETAKRLEEQLAGQPEDLRIRATLISYYQVHNLSEALVRHVLWVIEHHPESDLAVAPPSLGWGRPRNEGLEAKKTLWAKVAETHPNNARALGNAAIFLTRIEPVSAAETLRRALQLDPNHAGYAARLAHIYVDAILAEQAILSGLQPAGLWGNADPAFFARVRNELAQSGNAVLVGTVGETLARSLHSRSAGGVANYAESLLRRANDLQPGESRWSNSIAFVRSSLQADSRRAEPETRRVFVPESEQNKRLVAKLEPTYPALAQRVRVGGEVHLRLLISPDGRVTNVEILDGHPLLAPAAMEAVKNWRYQPTVVQGYAAEVETHIEVSFRLPPRV